MAMQAESLEVLEKAAVPPAQARAIVRAIEIELNGARDVLATRQDLAETNALLRSEMSSMRSGLREEITALGAGLRREMGDIRAEIHASASSVTRQMYMAVLGQSAVMLGFAYFVATQLR